MDIKRLTHLVALADKRNFARAAELSNLTQPALTRSIQAAEGEVGLRLFDRGGNDVRPTPAGEFVLERARRLVFDSRCLKRDIALYRNSQLGDTAFGVGPFPAATFLPSLLVALRATHPQVKLRIEVGNWDLLTHHLRDEDIEFFIADTRDLPNDSRLLVRALRRETGSFYVRCGHPLATHVAVSLAQAWAFGIASVRLPRPVLATLGRLIGLTPGENPAVALQCDDIETLKRVALDTDTVLAAPDAAVAALVAQGVLVALPLQDVPSMFSEMGVVTLRGRTPSPMAEAIVARLPWAAPGEGNGARPAPRRHSQ